MDHERHTCRAVEIVRGNPEAYFGTVIVDREITAGVFEEECDALFEEMARWIEGYNLALDLRPEPHLAE